MYNLFLETKAIAQALEENHLPYALCGGLAVGIYTTEPRHTIDIDMVVDPQDLEKIIPILAQHGFQKFAPPMPLDKGLMQIQRLIKMQEGETEVLMLDLCMPDKSTYPEVWKNWNRSLMEDREIWVLSKPGLIAMKKSRQSTKDLSDIEALEME